MMPISEHVGVLSMGVNKVIGEKKTIQQIINKKNLGNVRKKRIDK